MAFEEVFQQFKGPLSELAHATTKLIIMQDTPPSSIGGGAFGQVGSSALAATGADAVANNIRANLLGGKKFEVQINPEKYQTTSEVKYNTPKAQGNSAPQLLFRQISGEFLEINFTLDGTGVVPASMSDIGNFAKQNLYKLAGATDVSYVTKRIEELKHVIYAYDFDKHEPPIVNIAWGDVPSFKGRLESMTVNYTLFHPSGIPLRAEISLKFKEHKAVKEAIEDFNAGVEEATKAAKKLTSPDITHRRTVTQYDTLPLLTREVYNNAAYYWQVAQANNLTHFRQLREKSDLFFPPIDRSTQAK